MAHLTEPGIRSYCIDSLNACKTNKMAYYTRIVNLSLFAGFVLLATIILYCKRRSKQTPEEKKEKNELDRLHILNRIKQIQINKRRDTNMIITDVPGAGDFF